MLVLPKNTGLEDYKSIFDSLPNKRILVRGEDVPLIVEKLIKKGVESIGLTGEDLFLEYKIKNSINVLGVLKKIEWKSAKALYKKPALCLLGPKGKKPILSEMKGVIVINKKYKSIAENYLGKLIQKGVKLEKLYLTGAVEEAVTIGLADYAIDIVYSGFTAEAAGLRVYERIFESDIVIIGKRGEEND